MGSGRCAVSPETDNSAIQHRMPKRVLQRIRDAVRSQKYDVTKHAVDEMAEDGLDIVDVEAAILNGSIVKTEKDDPRGALYRDRAISHHHGIRGD